MKRTFVQNKKDDLKALIKLGGRRSEPKIVERIAGDDGEDLAEFKKANGFGPHDIPSVSGLNFEGDCFEMERRLWEDMNIRAIEWHYRWNAGMDSAIAITWKMPPEFTSRHRRKLEQYDGSNTGKTTKTLAELQEIFDAFINAEKAAKRVNGATLSVNTVRLVTKSGTVYLGRLFTPKKNGKGNAAGAKVCIRDRKRDMKPYGPIKLEILTISFEVDGNAMTKIAPKTLKDEEDLKTFRAMRKDLGTDQLKACHLKKLKPMALMQEVCEEDICPSQA